MKSFLVLKVKRPNKHRTVSCLTGKCSVTTECQGASEAERGQRELLGLKSYPGFLVHTAARSTSEVDEAVVLRMRLDALRVCADH